MRDKDIIRQAMENFDDSVALSMPNREDALTSSRFVDGNQWPEDILSQRTVDKRPCLTINKLRKFVFQIMGEIQQNRPDLMIRPISSSADMPGAIVRDALIKDIERNSNAQDAYDHAIQQALDGGFGYWRIVTDYVDDESFNQDILIKMVPNRFSVILDQHADGKVFEDAEYGFVTTIMSREQFKREYGNKLASSFPNAYGDYYTSWYSTDWIRVAEYFWKDYKKTKLYQLDDGSVIQEEAFSIMRELNPDLGSLITRERTVQKTIVKWAKLTENAIVEGPTDFPSSYIPIVPVLGYEYNEEGRRRFRSLVHDALDPMRMFNYWKTYATEMIALAPKSPYIVTPQQLEGYESQWDDANVVPYSYMFYNFIPGIPKPQREPPVPIPSAAINEINMAASDIQDVIGMYAPSLGEPSNERSGRAIIARQAQANNTVFTFINNFQRALIQTGKIILDMMPSVYDTTRIIQILGKGGVQELKINYPTVDPINLIQSIQNDITKGKYDIVPTVGPTYATKRMQTAASMLDFLQFAPQAAPLVGPRLANLMDWEGAQTIGMEMQQLLNQQLQSSPPGKQAPAPGETATMQAQTQIP